MLHPRTRGQGKLRETGKLICHELLYRQSLREHPLCQLFWKKRGSTRSSTGFLSFVRSHCNRAARLSASDCAENRRCVGRCRLPSLGIDFECGFSYFASTKKISDFPAVRYVSDFPSTRDLISVRLSDCLIAIGNCRPHRILKIFDPAASDPTRSLAT